MIVAKTNINFYIWVKLTDEGYKIYYERHKKLIEELSAYGYKINLTTRALNIDDEGWCKFQIWDFMEIFGEHMCIGMSGPIETEVKIEVYEDKKGDDGIPRS